MRNSRYNVLNAVAMAISINMIHPFIGMLAVKLGADDIQLGYLSSWPNAISVIAVLGAAAAVARSKSKQRLIAAIFLLGRAAALGVAAVPYFPERYRVLVLIGFWVLAYFPNSAAGTAMQSFLADVFPGTERGKALAARNSWSTGAGMIVVFGTGWLLDHVFSYPGGYTIMFSLSFAFALLEIYFFLQLKESPAAAAPTQQPQQRSARVGWKTYMGVFSHRPFARFMTCSLLFHFTWQMAWPIFTRYQVTNLGADNTWASLLTVANSAVAVLTYPIWNRMGERFGNRKVMPVATIWMALAPILTAMTPNLPLLVLLNCFTGIAVAGITVLVLNNLLDVSPAEGRPVYLAVHSALISVSATIAPMVGAFLITSLPIRTALVLCTVFRFITGSTFLLLMKDDGQGNDSQPENKLASKPA